MLFSLNIKGFYSIIEFNKMANRINRYKAIYEKRLRPNNASPFPRHVFVRGANLHASVYDRVGNR